MKFDISNKETWPEDNQDVQVWSSDFGFTHATFFPNDEDQGIEPGLGNWFDRVSDAEDADLNLIGGVIEWWPLPTLETSPYDAIHARKNGEIKYWPKLKIER